MDWILNHWQDIVMIITGVISIASIIVSLTPTKKDDEALGKVIKVLNYIALNFKRKV
jgi:hypothetical protein